MKDDDGRTKFQGNLAPWLEVNLPGTMDLGGSRRNETEGIVGLRLFGIFQAGGGQSSYALASFGGQALFLALAKGQGRRRPPAPPRPSWQVSAYRPKCYFPHPRLRLREPGDASRKVAGQQE